MDDTQTHLTPGSFSREMATALFGELDVRRAERRGLAYYVGHIATPKVHYLAFAAALLQYDARWRLHEEEPLQRWIASLPELLRGALIWWTRSPSFSIFVLRHQRQHHYWPFDRGNVR